MAFGITGVVFSAALSATTSSARTTSLNIKPRVRFWKQRASSVSHATSLDNTHAFVVKSAIAKITSEGRALSMIRTSQSPVQSVTMTQVKPRILACLVSKQ